MVINNWQLTLIQNVHWLSPNLTGFKNRLGLVLNIIKFSFLTAPLAKCWEQPYVPLHAHYNGRGKTEAVAIFPINEGPNQSFFQDSVHGLPPIMLNGQ